MALLAELVDGFAALVIFGARDAGQDRGDRCESGESHAARVRSHRRSHRGETPA
jgi:hypothetical protein